MKKVITILLSLIMIFSLAACSSKEATSSVDAQPSTPSSSSHGSKVLIAYFSMPEDVDTNGVDAIAGSSIAINGATNTRAATPTSCSFIPANIVVDIACRIADFVGIAAAQRTLSPTFSETSISLHASEAASGIGIILNTSSTATCFFSIKDDVINAGATYLDQEVVQDGNLITSRTPDDLPAFCRTIIAALEG